MSEILRPASKGDEPSLKKIWHAVFGDSMTYIDAFFALVFPLSSALVLEADGEIASAVYILPIGSLALPDGTRRPCTVSYAFATLPAYRSRGYGALIAKAAVDKTLSEGYETALICPAEDSLFGYYADRVGYHDFFYTNERFYMGTGPAVKGNIRSARADEYSEMREDLLKNRAHVIFDDRFMQYQAYLCAGSGGLFIFEADGEKGCFAAERGAGGSMIIKELLKSGGAETDALPLIRAALPSEKYIVRSPVGAAGGGRRFAMLQSRFMPEIPSDSPAPWFGFAFD